MVEQSQGYRATPEELFDNILGKPHHYSSLVQAHTGGEGAVPPTFVLGVASLYGEFEMALGTLVMHC